MAGGKSRWADSEADAAHEAKLRKEKEEKKRLKVEKARKLEAGKQSQSGANTTANGDAIGQPPSKRRRVTPEPSQDKRTSGITEAPETKLLRFNGGSWGPCRSVENYDKLNDIEEGAYGWVARAKELASGRVVALKRLKVDANDRSGLPVTGLREIQILKDCDHRNVVDLLEVVVGDGQEKIEKYGWPTLALLIGSLLIATHRTASFLFSSLSSTI
jgi:cell division cycle 2-like